MRVEKAMRGSAFADSLPRRARRHGSARAVATPPRQLPLDLMRKAFFDPHPGHSPERFQAIGRGLGVASVPWWGGAPLDEGLSPDEPFDDGNRLGHAHRGPTTHVDGDAGLAPGRRGQQGGHDIADESEVPPLAAIAEQHHALPMGDGVDEAVERHVWSLAWTVDGKEPQGNDWQP